MDLYLPNGYINMEAVLAASSPIIMVIGARGCGKTYGTLKALAGKELFIYFRRTQRIVELITDPALHIFKRFNTDTGREIRPEYSKGIGRFYENDKLIGYAAALSTFASVRGFDGSDCTVCVYDEFIPEPTERLTFNAYTALLNAYETINRNRELEGRPPLKLLLLSNSDRIYSDIVAGFGVGDKLLYMQETGTEELQASPELLLIRPRGETFEEEKAKTAIYRAAAGGSFADVALHNLFPIEDRQRVGIRPLKEYKAVAMIHGIIIYRHKTDGSYYVTDKLSGAPKAYDATEADRRRFLREQAGVWRAHQRRKVYFSGIDIQTRFKDLYE